MARSLDATHLKWMRALEDAVDSDQGAQKEEAADEYEHLSSTLSTAIRKSGRSDVSLGDMLRVQVWFAKFIQVPEAFPIGVMSPASPDNRQLQKELSLREQYQVYNVPAEVADQQSAQVSTSVRPNNGTLFPAVTKPLHKGGKLVSFDIDRWGFKDDVIKGVQDAYITITTVDGKGNMVGSSQNTPVTNNLGGNYVVFKCQVHIQQSIDKLPPNSALFFEFKCNTARKDADSTKAFCFIDWDELRDLQPGKCALEVYRAPPDFTRKTRPQLLSKKPLYLHLNASTQEA